MCFKRLNIRTAAYYFLVTVSQWFLTFLMLRISKIFYYVLSPLNYFNMFLHPLQQGRQTHGSQDDFMPAKRDP